MRRFVSRALLTTAVAVSAACSSAGGAGVALGGDVGGRYLVMIPPLDGPSGDLVANELRTLVTGMATHAALSNQAIRESMSQYDIDQLNEITARQLAQVIRVPLLSWGTVTPGGVGLQASVKFIDTGSGDEIQVDNVTGATPPELAAAIFASFETSVEGIRQAAFCNDYLSSEQFERAITTCESALAIVPNSTSALYGKATALLRLERDDEALATYAQLLDLDPVHQDALLGSGFAASRLGRDDAMTFYNRYMEVNPGNVQVRMTVANDIAETGDYVSAFRLLEPGIAENADNRDFQVYLFAIATAGGQHALERRDSTAATEIFTAALRAYQAAYPAGSELEASALRQAIAVNTALGRTDDAIRLAQEATQRFSDDPQIWSQYATVLTSAGRHADVVTALTRVIAINPEYENVYIRRGQAYLAMGQRQPAMADLAQAAERGAGETVAQVLYNIAVPLVQRDQPASFAEAVPILESAFGYATGELRSNIAFYWGYSLYKQGEAIARANTQGAAAEARRALAFFQGAMSRLESSSHASKAQVVGGAQQYIANQEAILGASR